MRILIRHFFQPFLDKESFSPQGEPEANLTQALGFLAAPGAFIVLLFQPLGFRPAPARGDSFATGGRARSGAGSAGCGRGDEDTGLSRTGPRAPREALARRAA